MKIKLTLLMLCLFGFNKNFCDDPFIIITKEQMLFTSAMFLGTSMLLYGLALKDHLISKYPKYASSIYTEFNYEEKVIQQLYLQSRNSYFSQGTFALGLSGLLIYGIYKDNITTLIQDKIANVLCRIKEFRN